MMNRCYKKERGKEDQERKKQKKRNLPQRWIEFGETKGEEAQV